MTNATRLTCGALALAAAALLLLLSSCGDAPTATKQVIVLGFDGMDPKLCEEMINQGRLPTLARLRDAGGYRRLGTSTPPQSPVAWCTFMTGTNPGQHGIFDFLHRDPDTYLPHFSMSKTEEGGWPISLGKYVVHLKAGKVVNLRRGEPFWKYLTQAGVPAQIYRMPAAYPPQESQGADFCCLSDMGTPDIRGTQGEFSFYTDGPFNFRRRMGGGKAYRVRFIDHVARTYFYGPRDSMLKPKMVVGRKVSPPPVETPLTIHRDPTDPTVRLVWDDQQVLLAQGEWSEWQPVQFRMGPQLSIAGHEISPLVPGSTAKAICRFYLKQVHPNFELYVTPLNVDPLDPVLPISQPADFVTELAQTIGRHYTQGLPEDDKVLRNEIFTRDEFLQQAQIVLTERLRMLDYALGHFEAGLLFFYFGSTDQVAHMFWGARQPGHPALTDQEHEKYKHVIEEVYERMDAVAAKVIDRFPEATVVVMSDHGFETFTRQFNLNTWLVDNGYATPLVPTGYDVPLNFKWRQTRAYALGINGLYVNLHGRERDGIVPPEQKQGLLDEIAAQLLAYRDPQTGRQVIKEVYQADLVYSGPNIALGPDLQIGYAAGYRGSWTTALGQISENIVADNTEAWCADHSIATDLVPGELFATRPVDLEDPTLEDLAPTLLSEFGVAVPGQMHGRNVFSGATAVARMSKE